MEEQIAIREKRFNEKEFMEFVSEQIDKFKNHAEIIRNPDSVTIADLNHSLSEYSVVMSTLLSLQALAHIEARKHRERFEDWFSEKYLMIRNRENPKNLSAQKWAGQKELERMVRVEYNFEYKGFRDLMDMAELRETFLGRMVEAWKSHQFILGHMCKNVQAEIMITSSGLSKNFGD
jgi:hypothetical protein